jgi:hypothetical protein
MTRPIKVREFEAWLNKVNERDPDFFVGIPRSKFECPISEFVRCRLRPDEGSVFVLTSYVGWEINGREYVQLLPKTLQQFIGIIDDNPKLMVTASDAIHALRLAKKRRA